MDTTQLQIYFNKHPLLDNGVWLCCTFELHNMLQGEQREFTPRDHKPDRTYVLMSLVSSITSFGDNVITKSIKLREDHNSHALIKRHRCPWGQKGGLYLLELKSQVVSNHLTWVLGPKLRSSSSATSVLKHEAIFVAPSF